MTKNNKSKHWLGSWGPLAAFYKNGRGVMALEVPELPSGNPQLQKALAKVVRAEQRPIDKVDERIAKIDNKLGLLKDLKSKFSDIKNAVKPLTNFKEFRELKAFSSHPDVLDATSIDKDKAIPGSYEIEVVQLANSSSLMTTGVADRDKTELGVGWVSFSTPDGESHDIYIGSDENTLDGIAAKINRAGLGIRAQVVNDGTDSDEPWRLILSSEKTGWKNEVDWAEFNFLDGDLDLDRYKQRDAQSAVIKINGQPIYVDSNSVKEIIPGVTFDLKKAAVGQTVKVEVRPDLEKIEGRAKDLVDKLNGALTFFQNQARLDAASRNDPTKALAGDTGIQAIHGQLRSVIQQTLKNTDEATIQRLGDIGIVFNRNGTLDYDNKKFQSALEKNFEEVSDLVSGDSPLTGFANAVNRLADSVIRTGDGSVSVRERNFAEAKQRLEKEKETKTMRAERKIERARTQFARAEQAMSQLANMGSAIQNQIASAGGAGR